MDLGWYWPSLQTMVTSHNCFIAMSWDAPERKQKLKGHQISKKFIANEQVKLNLLLNTLSQIQKIPSISCFPPNVEIFIKTLNFVDKFAYFDD